MDVHEFVKYYFGSLCEKMIPVLKIEPKALIDSIMAGLGAMAKNDGSALNRDVFWKAAAKVSGVDLIKYEDMFTDYYNLSPQRPQPSLILMQKNVLILQKKTDTK
jgi:hypothetical protein